MIVYQERVSEELCSLHSHAYCVVGVVYYCGCCYGGGCCGVRQERGQMQVHEDYLALEGCWIGKREKEGVVAW